MADTKWTVDFHDELNVQLNPEKLTGGEVGKDVQQEINLAIRDAVLSTLKTHSLLNETEHLKAKAPGPLKEPNVVKHHS